MLFRGLRLVSAVGLTVLVGCGSSGGGAGDGGTPGDGGAVADAAVGGDVAAGDSAAGDGAAGADAAVANNTPLGARTIQGTISLPPGLTVAATSLTVVSSLDTSPVSAALGFSLRTFDNGPQLGIVLSPAGNPMLLGWIDPQHTVIDAQSTAAVLIYFASGAALLPQAVRAQAVALIPQFAGMGDLAATISAQLVTSPDAFAQLNAPLKSALNAALTKLTVNPTTYPLILTQPGEQSGVTINQDPPYAAHLTNTFRRRCWAFVEKVSSTDSMGQVTPDPQAITDFEVPPVGGLSGGVFGAFTDIINAYYGNQTTAYGPIDAPDPPFSVPLVGGSAKTSYKVTLVGPGVNAGAEANLKGQQVIQLSEVSMRGFAVDALVPFLVNFVLGSGVIDFQAGQTSDQGKLLANIVGNVTTDVVNFIPQVPGLLQQIEQGKWQDATLVLWNNATASNTLRMAIEQSVAQAVTVYKNANWDPGKFSSAFTKFNAAVNAAGGLTQAFDSFLYARALGSSDRADQWTLDVLPAKVRLDPARSTIAKDGMVAFNAVVVDATDTTGYSYLWTTTGQAGQLQQVGGNSQQGKDFCASTAMATYLQQGDFTDGVVETVTVEVFPGPRCEGTALGKAEATVTLTNNPFVGTWTGTLTDGRPGYPPSSTFTATITAEPPNILHIAWQDAPYGSGGYDGTWSGSMFSAANGRVIGQLQGPNNLVMTEADSMQKSVLTKVH